VPASITAPAATGRVLTGGAHVATLWCRPVEPSRREVAALAHVDVTTVVAATLFTA
jgi:hypothetical protein